jgi:3-isopropylmalate/(R)-2-methylmalate dehydratase large subunit
MARDERPMRLRQAAHAADEPLRQVCRAAIHVRQVVFEGEGLGLDRSGQRIAPCQQLGTTDMANAFVTGAVRFTMPEVLRIECEGVLPPGVSARDLVLHLLALPPILAGAGAGVGRGFEFGGSAVRALSTDERATLTNMTAELGGFTGMVEPDEETVRFLKQRRGVDFMIAPWMRSDDGAAYAQVIRIDASRLSPMVARPGDPGQGVPLAQLAERPVPAVRHRRRARVLHGARLPVAFEAVGAELLQPACGACANCGLGASTDAGQVSVSAVNRNFAGRSGPGQVWLASPATVAASAIAGRLIGFAELQDNSKP